jgi:hypothetical protein
MPNFPMPPELQAMIDWCNQPAPQFAGDTHALHFELNPNNAGDLTQVRYQGFLFFRPPPVPTSPRRGSHFEGTGHIAPTSIQCAKLLKGEISPFWVRIAIALPPQGANASFRFFDPAPSSNMPGTPRQQFELDVIKIFDGEIVFSDSFGSLLITKTTVLI